MSIEQAVTAPGSLTLLVTIASAERIERVGGDAGADSAARTIEEVHMFLLERGIDSLSLPPPPLRIVNEKKE